MFEATLKKKKKKKLEKPPIAGKAYVSAQTAEKPYAPSASILSCASKRADRSAAAV